MYQFIVHFSVKGSNCNIRIITVQIYSFINFLSTYLCCKMLIYKIVDCGTLPVLRPLFALVANSFSTYLPDVAADIPFYGVANMRSSSVVVLRA